MVAINAQRDEAIAARKQRSNEIRTRTPAQQAGQLQQQPGIYEQPPAAGAHAAAHLINEDATPGAGALPSATNCSGKEVDGGAG